MRSRRFHSSPTLSPHLQGKHVPYITYLPLLHTEETKWRQDVRAPRWDPLEKKPALIFKILLGLEITKIEVTASWVLFPARWALAFVNAVCYVTCVGDTALLESL